MCRGVLILQDRWENDFGSISTQCRVWGCHIPLPCWRGRACIRESMMLKDNRNPTPRVTTVLTTEHISLVLKTLTFWANPIWCHAQSSQGRFKWFDTRPHCAWTWLWFFPIPPPVPPQSSKAACSHSGPTLEAGN